MKQLGLMVVIGASVGMIIVAILGGQMNKTEEIIWLAATLFLAIRLYRAEDHIERLQRRAGIRGMLRISPDSYGQRALDEIHGRN